MTITRERAEHFGMSVWDDAPLPRLPELYTGIYVREGGARAAYEQLADEFANRVARAGYTETGAGDRRRAEASGRRAARPDRLPASR